MRITRTPYRRPGQISTGLVAVLAAASLAGCTAASTGSENPTAVKSSSPTTGATTDVADETPAPEPGPTPEPDGTYTSSCDYVLGDFTEHTKTGFRFIAEAKLQNTGNIGTVLRVKAVWYLSGGGKVKRTKTVRLRPGHTKRAGFTVPVGSDEIDRYQALGYGDDRCKVKAAMVDTFGEPR
jgi:hypothetical protein